LLHVDGKRWLPLGTPIVELRLTPTGQATVYGVAARRAAPGCPQ